MKLSIKDRLILPGIFATNKDSMTEAAVQRAIRVLVSVKKDEADDIELKHSNNGSIWNALKAEDKEFAFDSAQLNYLRESVYNLSKSGGITQDLLPLCEKIQGFG